MAELLANGQVKKSDGSIVTPANGEWVEGRRLLNGQLLAPNEYEPGKFTSAAVNNQSAAAQGVSPDQFNTYLQSQTQKVNGDLAAAGLGGDSSGGGSGTGSSIGSTGPINLQNIYDQAYASAGITGLQDKYKTLQDQLTTKEQALANAKADINENPFYSEGNRTGVISKLDQAAQNDMNVLIKQQAALQDQINSAKTDVDTKLNIATKQFDINSSASTQALSQFNTLLSAGALDNASAADINQFAAATGISTSMINSAVKLSKQKNTESKMIETTDDYGNVRVSLIQIKDGQMQVVSQQSLGNVAKSSGSSQTSAQQQQQIAMQLTADAKAGVPLVDYGGGTDILKIYGPFLDANTIYNLYNSNSVFGPAKETLSDLAKYGVKDINKDPFNIYPAAQ